MRHNGGTGESPKGCAFVDVQFLICSIYSLCILHAFQCNNSQQILSHMTGEMDKGMLMDELPTITGVPSAVILKSEGDPIEQEVNPAMEPYSRGLILIVFRI